MLVIDGRLAVPKPILGEDFRVSIVIEYLPTPGLNSYSFMCTLLLRLSLPKENLAERACVKLGRFIVL